MAKTLQDYLGASATINNTVISFDAAELYDLLFPNAIESLTVINTDDEAIALLIGGLHETAKAEKDVDGNDVVDKETSLVSSDSFSPKTFEVREEEAQVKHEFIFSVYTTDNTAFNPRDAV